MAYFFHNGHQGLDARWHWKKLLLCHVLAGALLVSLFWEPASAAWAWADEAAFFAMNGTLSSNEIWQKTMAFANTRLYDKLSTLLLIGVLLSYVLLGWGEQMPKRLAIAVFVGLYMLIFTYGRRQLGLFEFDRASPSLELLPFYDLREMYPEMRPKTASGNAFPSDHAIACILFVSLFWYYAGWKAGLISAALMPIFMLPRLFGGAHWLSDAVIGGGFYALMIMGWAVYSPLGSRCIKGMQRGFSWGQTRALQTLSAMRGTVSKRRS